MFYCLGKSMGDEILPLRIEKYNLHVNIVVKLINQSFNLIFFGLISNRPKKKRSN